MVEGSGLENRRGETHRGFESLLRPDERARFHRGTERKRERDSPGRLRPLGFERATGPLTIEFAERWPSG